MKAAMIFDYIENKEVSVNVFDYTRLSIGSKVTHTNEGQSAGSSGIIRVGLGEVLDVNYQGQNVMGGSVFTAQVKWSNGETFSVATTLLERT